MASRYPGSKVKITIVKKVNSKDLFGDNPPLEFAMPPECQHLELGQEFISIAGQCPEGFCPWAFADIHRDIIHLRLGGNYPWMKKKVLYFPAVLMV